MFIYFHDQRLIFSTEYKSIVKHPLVNTAIDQEFIRTNIIHFEDNIEKSLWKNVNRLKPAHSMTIEENSIFQKRYWRPKYKRSKFYKNSKASADALKAVLEKSIYDRMRVLSHPIGIPLSGGLDSSTITCIASKKLKNKNLVTVSSVLEKEI